MTKNPLRKPFPYSYTRVTLSIILINIILYLVTSMFYPKLTLYLSMCPAIVIQYKFYWQFLTYMFMHANMNHIVCNMLGILIFGLRLERAIGSKEFLLFYLLCGTLSGIFSFVIYYYTGNNGVLLLGASGALYAVLFAYAVFFPHTIIYIWGIIPVPAPIMVLIYAVVEFFSQFYGKDSTAHMTHLFGFVAAWLYLLIRMGINPLKVWKRS